MVEKIAFQSIGGVEGIYLPSEDNLRQGSILTDYGIFPAEISKQVKRKLPQFTGHPIEDPQSNKRLRFLAWVKGESEHPYYSLELRLLREQFPEWVEGDNWFYFQGIITERTSKRVLLRMQRNPWKEVTAEQLEKSINYLQLKNCPGNVRKSQFWKFTACFKEGFLNCQTAEMLANATETKKILKSWATEPIESSRYEELLKK